MEKAASPKAKAVKQAKIDEALVKSLEGAVFTHPTFPGRVEFQFRALR